MKYTENVRNFIYFLFNRFPKKLEGKWLMRLIGHRFYVGGMWDIIGELEFNFLKDQGLKPSHCFLDIACGCLRGGIHFINYLEPGNYLGIDKEKKLISIGINKELGVPVYENKKPEFIISEYFEFNKFTKKPKFSLANSLFTHLNPEDIRLCMKNLRKFVDKDHILFATFFEGDSFKNCDKSHSVTWFRYSKQEMEKFGIETGWKPSYIGDWNHPRYQMMMKYEAL
jgi:hypothetical protein